MGKKVRGLKRSNDDDEIGGYIFYCPGCKEDHLFTIDRWTFNGDLERPTFTPSLLYPSKAIRCHLYVTDGKIQYLTDCGHELAGQTVDVPDWED
jgi:hypothetical protein